MVSMIPRASVAAERIVEVLDTDSSVTPPVDPITSVREHGTVDFDDVGFTYPGAAHAVLSDISFTVRPGPHHRDHREHRLGQVDARRPRAAPLRRDRRIGVGQRRRRPTTRPRSALGVDRLRPAEAVPLLRNGGVEPSLRATRCHRRRTVAGTRSRAGRGVRPVDAQGPRQPDHPGRHERVGWAAPTPVDRPSARAAPRPLRVRRLVLGARPRHRRPPAARASTARGATPAC